MAIMAMDTVKTIYKSLLVVTLMLLTSLVHSGEWTVKPNLGLEETYTDNVKLTSIEATSTFVGQLIAGLDINYESSLAELTFSGTQGYALYSYDSKSNDDYRTLQAQGSLALWSKKLTLIADANISNVSRNKANNSFADIITGDTVESANYSSGLAFNVGNIHYSVQSSLIYNTLRAQDNIGESDGYTAILNSASTNAARHLYWQLNSSYAKRTQKNHTNSNPNVTNEAEKYALNFLIGAITPIHLNPFVRFYDENVEGNTVQNMYKISSWGAGTRWLASEHVILDLSYNFITDKAVNDDYLAGSIDWQPSGKTSLKASFSQRFFGNSYRLNFQHRTRRLTNNISYNESLEVFDRSNYQDVPLGSYWCSSENFTGNIEQCFQEDNPQDPQIYDLLIPFSSIELIESNEFFLHKKLFWSSKLQLSRSAFTFKVEASQSEGLESGIVDDNVDLELSFSRQTSVRGELSISSTFRHSLFDKTNPKGTRQDDYYRTISSTYSLALASTLSSHFTLRYINRTSNIDRYVYDEVRAVINITKDF